MVAKKKQELSQLVISEVFGTIFHEWVLSDSKRELKYFLVILNFMVSYCAAGAILLYLMTVMYS